MNLENPISVTPPSITKKDGTVKTFKPVVLKTLDLTIVDNVARKTVAVRIRPLAKPLVLWTGSDYDAAGDYTQAMVEAKVLELLGDNPSEVLSNLFIRPSSHN
jgi:hypothetical protein